MKLVQAFKAREVPRAALLEEPSFLVSLLTRAFGFGQKGLLLKRGDGRTILQRAGNVHLFSTSSLLRRPAGADRLKKEARIQLLTT
jgi:hypothetical protein